MTWIADAGHWTALVLAGLITGMFGSRWGSAPARRRAPDEWLLLAAAAAAVVAWCATAGALLGASTAPQLPATVPIDVGPWFRVAVMWATLHGAALSFGAILLVAQALSTGATDRNRFACVVSALAFVSLTMSVWFAPGTVAAVNIPPFVQSAAAAIAPLLALVAIIALAWAMARVLSGASASRTTLLCAWIASTAALVFEQEARSQLGIGPRDAVVLGSASAGLVMWLLTSALLHRRAQRVLIRDSMEAAAGTSHAKLVAAAAHVGAVCVAVSFALHAFATRATISLPPGVAVGVTDAFRKSWQLVNQGVSRFDAEGVDVTALTVEARSPDGAVRLVAPQNREFHGREGQHVAGEIALRESTGGPFQQMRILLIEADSLDVASVRVTFLPAPILWPIGIALMGLAALVALSASRINTAPQTPST